MKQIFIFIGLKIAEIAGLLFALLIGSRIWLLFEKPHNNFYTDYLLGGVMGLLVLFLCVAIPIFVVFGTYSLIKHNWQWAKRITNK